MQGSSLKTLIEGQQKSKLHDVVYAELHTAFSAVISKEGKFILDLNTGKKELFDLNNDPDEQINICKGLSSTESIPLERHLNLWLSNNEKLVGQLSGNKDSQRVELNEDRLRELRSLGYLQ